MPAAWGASWGNAWGNAWGGSSGPGIETPPDDLVAVLDGTEADLSWTDDVSDNTGYAVERSVEGAAFVEIEADAGDVETYTDTGPLDPAGWYRYRLRVLGGALDGEYSNIARIGTGPFVGDASSSLLVLM